PGQGQRPTVNYTYTNSYYLHTIQGENGFTTTITRDGNNRVTEIDYPDGGVETFPLYNGFNQVLTHAMPTGGTEMFTYDGRGLKQTYRNPDNVTGNPTVRYQYDILDRLTDVTDVFGTAVGDGNHSTSFTYNDRGQVLVTTLPKDVSNGNTRHTITNVYNFDGTLQTKTDLLNHVTSYVYDDYRRLTSVTLPDRGDGTGAHTTSYYYNDPWANRTDYADTDAQASFVVLPSGKTTWNMYDDNRRKWWTTPGWYSGEDATTVFEYDAVGNVTKVTTPNQQPGQLYNGKSTQTSYDERNRPSSVTDALNNITAFTYDTAGRQNKITR